MASLSNNRIYDLGDDGIVEVDAHTLRPTDYRTIHIGWKQRGRTYIAAELADGGANPRTLTAPKIIRPTTVSKSREAAMLYWDKTGDIDACYSLVKLRPPNCDDEQAPKTYVHNLGGDGIVAAVLRQLTCDQFSVDIAWSSTAHQVRRACHYTTVYDGYRHLDTILKTVPEVARIINGTHPLDRALVSWKAGDLSFAVTVRDMDW